MNDFVLLITSSIDPDNFNFVGRKGSEVREKDYIKAINFYKELRLPVVFIDNSNFHSKAIQNILDQFIDSEYLFFKSIDSHKGKGHGELEILNFAFDHSNLIKDDSVVVKVSGRYIIENLGNILNAISHLETVHFCNFSRNFSWVDTRLMIYNKFFFNNYFNPTCIRFLDELNGIYLEKVYARSIHFWMYEGYRIKLLPFPPFYNSYNGSTNERIFFSPFRKLKYLIFHHLKIWIFKQLI